MIDGSKILIKLGYYVGPLKTVPHTKLKRLYDAHLLGKKKVDDLILLYTEENVSEIKRRVEKEGSIVGNGQQ